VYASATANGQTIDDVSTTTINSNDLILGMSVCPTGAGQGAVASIWDTSETATPTSGQIIEIETAIGVSADVWFPYAKAVTSGITITAGATPCVVTIYYEDR
jgi:hypothetical protein